MHQKKFERKGVTILVHRLFFDFQCTFFFQLPMVLYVSLFLGDLTEYFDIDSPTLAEKRRAYLNALGLSLITVFLVILIGIGAFMGYKLGMLFRIICTTAMYKKVKFNLSMIEFVKMCFFMSIYVDPVS